MNPCPKDPVNLLVLLATLVPAAATDVATTAASSPVPPISRPAPTENPHIDPNPADRFTLGEDMRVLFMQDPMTGTSKTLSGAELESRAGAGPLVVSGRLDVVKKAGFRSFWVRHDGQRRLLLIGPSEADWPMVEKGQTILIRSARVIVPSDEASMRSLFPWTRLSERKLQRQPLLLLSTDDDVEVDLTRTF